MSHSKVLITRIQSWHEHKQEVCANASIMAPELDLIRQIFQTAQSSHISASFSWVKGHQDNLTEFDKLPLKAQQ